MPDIEFFISPKRCRIENRIEVDLRQIIKYMSYVNLCITLLQKDGFYMQQTKK